MPPTPPSYQPGAPQQPQYPPTQQMPPTQGYPVQGYAPGAPAPVPPPKKKTGWIIGGSVAAVAALVGGFLLLSGDDDKETGGGDTTLTTAVTTTAAVATTLAPEETFVITTPASTAPPVTSPPTAAPTTVPAGGEIIITDDTGTFSLPVDPAAQYDTTPQDISGATLAAITVAEDVEAYYGDDDTFGYTVLAVTPDVAATAAEAVAMFQPSSDVCATSSLQSGYATDVGPAELMIADSCGATSTSGKAVMAVDVPSSGFVLLVYTQGPLPSDSLAIVAQIMLESVTLL